MPRKPEQIGGLDDYQLTAYRKSFLRKLDSSAFENLTDWEAEFVASAMERLDHYTPKQVEVIEGLMDKFPKVLPSFNHYKEPFEAKTFVLGYNPDRTEVSENFFQKEV